jgi:DNA invertase Pin-like site-specific DNA recombinase
MKKITKLDALPQNPKRKRVAAYARVSSGKDAMRHSLSAQVSYYSNLIQRRIEWAFAGIYADEPIAGTKDNRPEFQRMLTDCRAGAIDMVITKSITRFARNTVTTLEAVRELKTLGIDVFFEKENIHSVSGDGELMLSILASFAQEESRSASENCKWRIRKMFEAGQPTFTRLLGYKWVDGKFQILPEEAEVVKQIFADYLSGLGKIAIAKKLNAMGVPTKNGGPWMYNTVDKILRNEKYAGNLILQKTFVEDHVSKKSRVNRGELPKYHIEDSHEAIIGRETFESAQREIARRAGVCKPPKQPVECYPFTGLIRCGTCGRRYQRKHAAAGSKYEKPVWICAAFNSLGKQFCSSQQIPEDILLAKTAEVLGVERVDAAALAAQVAEIQVPEHNLLVFAFHDGHDVSVSWQSPSRRESWTEEMKQTARARQFKILEERRKQHEPHSE